MRGGGGREEYQKQGEGWKGRGGGRLEAGEEGWVLERCIGQHPLSAYDRQSRLDPGRGVEGC